jgi:hypothetical protein
MPESDRPRRPVPAWVTAPPVDEVTPVERVAAADHVNTSGREARPASAPSRAAHAAPATTTAVGSAAAAPAATVPAASGSAAEPASIAALVETDAPVPDYPPQEDLLPPAPMSPSVHTVPFENPAVPAATIAPSGALAMPVSPVTAVPAPAPVGPPVVAPAPVAPVTPVAGQPRFSVPGLEHVVVEGTEPEPSGPIGYRTPRRFAHQQAAATRPAAPAPAHSFDAVLHPGPSATAAPAPPVVGNAPAAPVAPAPGPRVRAGVDPGLPTELLDQPVSAGAAPQPRRALGATAGAALGAVAGLATIGLATRWFTAPATVHGVGVALGVLALVLSLVALRDRTATWQRPVALLGAVLGGVGTVVLLWAVAAALLSLAGVTLPDVTGTGTTPTLAP